MSLKSINTSPDRFCTIIDVCAKFPKIVVGDINLDESDSPIVRYSYQIDQSIINVTDEITAALYPIYRGTTNLASTAPWIGLKISDGQNSDPKARLVAAAAGTSAIAEMFTLTFSSANAYTVTGWLSGGVGSSNSSSDYTSTGDGDLLLFASTNVGMFSGSFTTGDTVYIAVNKWHPMISTIATYLATADALRSIFFEQSINDESNLIEKLSNHAHRELTRLQNPDDKNGYSLSTLPSRDLSDIQMGDWDGTLADSFGQVDADLLQDEDIDNYTD